jgi:hypothetical protein
MRKGVANGVVIMPFREFEVPSGWYYRIYGVRNSDIGEITCGIKSVQKFINIRRDILWFWISDGRTSSLMGVGLVELG